MTDATIFKYATEAQSEENFMLTVREIADEYNGEDWDEAEKQMRELYHICNMPMKEVRAKTGMTQAAFADAINASKRTVESWDYGREPSPFIKFLILEYFRLLKRDL